MEGRTGGLLTVITTSIVLVSAAYLAITYSKSVGRITNTSVSALDNVARVWQS